MRSLSTPGQLDECLIVTVELRNLNAERKLEYTGWGGRGIEAQGVKLTDNKKNSYRRKVLPITVQSIYPGDTIQDRLIFERPIPSVDHLLLELPAAVFDKEQRDTLRFKIPMAMITAVTDQPDPDDPPFDGTPDRDERDAIERGIDEVGEGRGEDGEPPGMDFPEGEFPEGDGFPEGDADNGPNEDGAPSVFDDSPELRGDDDDDDGEEHSFEGRFDQFQPPAAENGPPQNRRRGRR